MQITETKLNFCNEDHTFSFNKDFDNGISFIAELSFQEEKFLEYQKDLIEEFISEYIQELIPQTYDIDTLKINFETSLQNLNTKLKMFAEKVRDIEEFPVRWYIQMVIDGVLITSMIWDISLLIFRDNALYYSLYNSIDTHSKIDLFSDFIEGDIESQDEIIYIGLKFSDVFDDTDVKQMQDVLKWEEDISLFLEDVLSSRIEQDKIHFINLYKIGSALLADTKKLRIGKLSKRNNKNQNNNTFTRIKKEILANKYYATIIVLWIVILFMLYHVLSQMLDKSNTDVFVTSSGIEVDITIEDIKKDIYSFQSLDAASDDKGIKYHEILQKLDLLEEKWRWLEDVAQLRGIIQADYHKGFNIIYLSSLSQLDDPATNIKTRIFNFNNAEKTRLGELIWLQRGRNMMIAWSNATLVSTINDDMRWTLMEYGSDTPVKWCSKNLLWDGLYCYSPNGKIFTVTNAGIENVTTTSPGGFPSDIAGIQVYWKSNIYIFQPTLNTIGKDVLLTRYRNVLGSQSQFQEWQNYKVAIDGSGNSIIGSGLDAFTIDSTFLVWSDSKLFQFWREVPTSNVLDVREIKLLGWDKVSSAYSSDVRIISTNNSKYVYIFDKGNQTFTVYESRPIKTNDAYSSSYDLYYLFRFKFELSENEVIDAVVPESTWNRPEVYFLSNQWVNKVNLYDFIDSVKEDNTLRTVQ